MAAAPYVIVRARGRLCALPVAEVVETLRPPVLVVENGGVRGLVGTAMLRGEPVAVLDLGELLGFAEDEGGAPGRAVVVRVAGRLGGQSGSEEAQCSLFLVDEVVGVRALEQEQLQRIALPGGGELAMGRFDEGFARLIEAGGLVDQALAARVAGQGAEPDGTGA